MINDVSLAIGLIWCMCLLLVFYFGDELTFTGKTLMFALTGVISTVVFYSAYAIAYLIAGGI